MSNPTAHHAPVLRKYSITPVGEKRSTIMGHDGFLDDQAAMEMAKNVQDPIYKFMDDAILRPNAAHRPTWGSDPMFQLVFHLKQFRFSFQNTILRRAMSKVEHGDMLRYAMLATYVPFTMGTATAKMALLGTMPDNFGAMDALHRGIAQSGVTGVGQLGTDAFKDAAARQVPGKSLAGPTIGRGIEIANTLAGAKGHGLAHLAEPSAPLSPLVKAFTHGKDTDNFIAD